MTESLKISKEITIIKENLTKFADEIQKLEYDA